MSDIVYIVIVTYNGKNDIIKCLNSVYLSDIPVKVIVIDNNSTDDTVNIIKKNYSEIEVMTSKKNSGFGKANNVGIKYAYECGAEYVLLLNQDAYIENNSIRLLKEIQEKNINYYVISPLQYDGSGERLDNKFSKHISKSSTINEILSDIIIKKKINKLYEVDFVNAAIWMISRKCIENIGLFNPVFSHYGEDLEYLHRVQQKGYRVGLSTESVAYHNRCQKNNNTKKNYIINKAEITYRLSRKKPGTITNILSVLQIAITSKGIKDKLKLFLFIGLNLYNILYYKKKAYKEKNAFFLETTKFSAL